MQLNIEQLKYIQMLVDEHYYNESEKDEVMESTKELVDSEIQRQTPNKEK